MNKVREKYHPQVMLHKRTGELFVFSESKVGISIEHVFGFNEIDMLNFIPLGDL